MFGYDEARLERIRTRRPTRWGIVALELFVFASGLLVLLTLQSFATQQGLQRVVNHLVGDAPVEVAVGDVNLVPWSRLLEPRSWQVSISDLDVTPNNADGPRIHADRMVVSIPDLIRTWARREVVFRGIRIAGLDLHLHRQRPPREWSPHKSALDLISVERLELSDASLRIEPDAPLGRVEVTDLRGVLADVEFIPGTRELHGTGDLRAATFTNGTLVLRDLHVPNLSATGSEVHIDGGTFSVARGRGGFSGVVTEIQRVPTTTMEVSLAGARFETLVENATGRKSPLQGLLEATLTLRAGGSLPRGEAWLNGNIRITDASLDLGDRVKEAQMDVLRSAPFIAFDDAGRVVLGDMDGDVRLKRGLVEFHDLLYHTPKRDIELDGQVVDGRFTILIRPVPTRDVRHAGVGLVLTGTRGDVKVRPATRQELAGEMLFSTPGTPEDVTAEPPGESRTPAGPVRDLLGRAQKKLNDRRRSRSEDTDP